MAANKVSRVLAGRYPPPGTSPIADAIRERRGPQGITPLDAALLHVPPVAGGWNALGKAVRSEGKLPGNIRELLILRIAAINHAAFEWIQHEEIGRGDGLNTAQLYVVRDEATPLPPAPGIFTELQISALIFADASTKNVKVGDQITKALKKDLDLLARKQNAENIRERTEDLFAEVALVVAVYNMVSRFLVAADVAGLSEDPVPWPIDRKEHFVSHPNSHKIHAVTITTSADAPWIVFANSLTNLHMWDLIIPHLISDSPNTITGKSGKPFNVLIHTQSGHGKSTLPDSPTVTTITSLASDIAHLLTTLNIPTPVHAIVGASQGDATSFAFARSCPELTRSIVVCDTSPKTSPGTKEAWADRIGVVYGGVSAEEILKEGFTDGQAGKGPDYSVKVGMGKLASIIVPRWFPLLLKDIEKKSERGERYKWVADMIENTPVHGFVAGAEALSDYDLYQPDEKSRTLFTSPIEPILLLTGSLDGAGNIGKGLHHLREEWNTIRCQNANGKPLEYMEIPSAGHLPMIDEAKHFAEVLLSFLDSF